MITPLAFAAKTAPVQVIKPTTAVSIMTRRVEGRFAWAIALSTENEALILDSDVSPQPNSVVEGVMRLVELSIDFNASMYAWSSQVRTILVTVGATTSQLLRYIEDVPSHELAGAALTAELDDMLPLAEEPEAEEREPLVVATDGSFGRGTRMAGFAFIASNGKWGAHAEPNLVTALGAELRAIDHALTSLPGRTLHILTDSKAAIEYITSGRVPKPRVMRKLVAKAHDAYLRGTLTLEWVKGHNGNAMNEAADRLALSVRRLEEVGLRDEAFRDIAQNIMNDYNIAAGTKIRGLNVSDRGTPSDNVSVGRGSAAEVA